MNTETSFEDIRALFAETAFRFQETDRRFQETDRRFQETDRLIEKLSRETNQKIRELGQQIGGLGNKFGSFTEGLALPSMEKILRQRFGVDTVGPSVRVSRNGKHLGNRRTGVCQRRTPYCLCGGGQKLFARGEHSAITGYSETFRRVVSGAPQQAALWHSGRRAYS